MAEPHKDQKKRPQKPSLPPENSNRQNRYKNNDGNFILKPLHECWNTNPESVADYSLESLSEEKFERLVSTLNSTEADELRNYLKYHSHDLLVKNAPSNIRQGKGFTIQDHDYGSSLTISPGDS